jgi:hypothetical protein
MQVTICSMSSAALREDHLPAWAAFSKDRQLPEMNAKAQFA